MSGLSRQLHKEAECLERDTRATHNIYRRETLVAHFLDAGLSGFEDSTRLLATNTLQAVFGTLRAAWQNRCTFVPGTLLR